MTQMKRFKEDHLHNRGGYTIPQLVVNLSADRQV